MYGSGGELPPPGHARCLAEELRGIEASVFGISPGTRENVRGLHPLDVFACQNGQKKKRP